MFLSPLLWIDLISDEKRPLFIRRANFFFFIVAFLASIKTIQTKSEQHPCEIVWKWIWLWNRSILLMNIPAAFCSTVCLPFPFDFNENTVWWSDSVLQFRHELFWIERQRVFWIGLFFFSFFWPSVYLFKTFHSKKWVYANLYHLSFYAQKSGQMWTVNINKAKEWFVKVVNFCWKMTHGERRAHGARFRFCSGDPFHSLVWSTVKLLLIYNRCDRPNSSTAVVASHKLSSSLKNMQIYRFCDRIFTPPSPTFFTAAKHYNNADALERNSWITIIAIRILFLFFDVELIKCICHFD